MKNKIIIILTLIVTLFISATSLGCKKDKNKEFTIQFVQEETIISEKKVTNGYVLVSSDFPSDPIKDGYKFVGWYVGSLKISAGYVINENTTAKATFEEEITPIIEDGTKEHPYLIKSSSDLVSFSDRLNHLDEEIEDPNYYKAHFALANNIDMTGVNYTPAGKVISIENDGEEQTIYGFMGELDGRGYTISNLQVNINMKTNREYYGGLFGITDSAYIHDLKLENINYSVESGSDDNNRSVSMGGVVGYASLTVFANIEVTGTINTYVFTNNPAFLGGLAGKWDVSDYDKSYYGYTINCHTKVETTIGEVDDEECSLDSGFNGGLFGYTTNYNGAIAVINCISEGKVYGGKYVGGLIGYISSDNTSLLDSGSYATVYATATEVSYTGGLAGMVSGDTVIKDCFFAGPVVRGTRASSSTYKSYAGGIVGYGSTDDYEIYYTAGLACVNSYYNTTVRGSNTVSEFGISTTDSINLSFAKSSLDWDDSVWQEENGVLYVANKSETNKEYTVSLVVNDQVVDTFTKEANSILGSIAPLENEESNIFYNWMLQPESIYRTFMPVTKDLKIYGEFYDISSISGVYSGTSTLYETKDAGLVVLNNDGTLQWINSSTVNGKYKYNGKYIFLEIFNNIGEVSGTLIDGNLKFIVDAGMSGAVSYDFNKSNLSIFGEYFSEQGDIITFGSEGSLSFQSTKLKDGNYINGTYTQEGNELIVSGDNLSSYYTQMTIVDNGDLTLTVNFIAKNDSIPSFIGVKFSKILNRDYSNYAFIGSYDYAYVSGSNPVLQTQYTLRFNEDGTGNYISKYSNVEFQYYTFNDGKTIKLILEGYASEFTYDESGNFFYGLLNRGSGTGKRGVALIPTSEGNIYGLVIDGIENIVYATSSHSYLFINAEYQKDAIIEINSFDDYARIYINNEAYIIRYETSDYSTQIGYSLAKVGSEEGTYTYNDKTLSLDGIGNVNGEIEGTYQVYDQLIVIYTINDIFIGFNYELAQANNNQIELITPDKYQGVWYKDHKVDGEIIEKYYKLLIDGYGHSTFMYLYHHESTDEYEYKYNWGQTSWVEITETETGITCDYNKYQHCEMRFYFDDQLMYSTKFGYLGEISMYKDGYTGSMVPPTLPSTAVGRYIGVDQNEVSVVLNLRQDLNGSYAGNPFVATFDGSNTVVFKVLGVVYTFNIDTLVLSFENTSLQLSSDGQIKEIIPEVICGEWSGNWSGMGSDNNNVLTIEKDGTIKYVEQVFSDVTFDYETYTIYASGKSEAQEPLSIVIVYNPENNTINVVYTFVYDGENYTINGDSLTKK